MFYRVVVAFIWRLKLRFWPSTGIELSLSTIYSLGLSLPMTDIVLKVASDSNPLSKSSSVIEKFNMLSILHNVDCVSVGKFSESGK